MTRSRLDEVLPEYDFVERHRVAVRSPAAALAGAKTATPGEMPLVRALFALRSVPALLTRGRGLPAEKGRPLVEQMVEFGFVPLAEGEDEVVLGFTGQPWKLSGGSMPRLGSADAWKAFDQPGYVKAVISFRAYVDPSASTGRFRRTRGPSPHVLNRGTASGVAGAAAGVLETETRIQATDPASRRRFARYWRLIRPGSGLIRRSWLRAAKRRSEC